MGLGKTVTMLGLFVHNAARTLRRIPSRQCQYLVMFIFSVVCTALHVATGVVRHRQFHFVSGCRKRQQKQGLVV